MIRPQTACVLFLGILTSVLGPSQQPPPAAAPSQAPENQKREEKLACGPAEVHHNAQTHQSSPALPSQPPDKALIYVVRPTHYGSNIQTKLGADGKWVGVNRAMNYFYFTLDPGTHYFCSQAENHSFLSLVVEGGKTYYLQQKIRMGVFKAHNELQQLDEREGKIALAKCKLSTFEEKK